MISGDFQARVTKVEFGKNTTKNIPEFKAEFTIIGGPHDRTKVWYTGRFDTDKNKRYTHATMFELGWSGKTSRLAVIDEIMKANLLVHIQVEIATWKNPETGEVREWSTVRKVGSGTSTPLGEMTDGELNEFEVWPEQRPAAVSDDEVPF